jgi:hypothetical protein
LDQAIPAEQSESVSLRENQGDVTIARHAYFFGQWRVWFVMGDQAYLLKFWDNQRVAVLIEMVIAHVL